MASLSTNDAGKHRIFYKAADGSRKILYCGKVAKKKATDMLRHIDDLERCHIDGSAPAEATSRWLADISNELGGAG